MRSRTLAALLTAAAALGLSGPVFAQISVGEGDVSRYDALYGKPVDVAVDDTHGPPTLCSLIAFRQQFHRSFREPVASHTVCA